MSVILAGNFLKTIFLVCMHFAIKGKIFSKGQATKFFFSSYNLYQISPKTHPIDLMEQLLFIELAVYYVGYCAAA